MKWKWLIVFLIFLGAYLFLLAPFIEQFVEDTPSAILSVESDRPIGNLTMYIPRYTFGDKALEIWLASGFNVEVVKTKFGEMWKIEARNFDGSGQISFRVPYCKGTFDMLEPYDVFKPTDIFLINLSPLLDRELTREESLKKRLTVVTNLTVPLYANYSGNITEIRIQFFADSGLEYLFGLLPVSPEHNGRVYTGVRKDHFTVTFRNWGNATGESVIDVVYQ